jgi:hypothetical protein
MLEANAYIASDYKGNKDSNRNALSMLRSCPTQSRPFVQSSQGRRPHCVVFSRKFVACIKTRVSYEECVYTVHKICFPFPLITTGSRKISISRCHFIFARSHRYQCFQPEHVAIRFRDLRLVWSWLLRRWGIGV